MSLTSETGHWKQGGDSSDTVLLCSEGLHWFDHGGSAAREGGGGDCGYGEDADDREDDG